MPSFIDRSSKKAFPGQIYSWAHTAWPSRCGCSSCQISAIDRQDHAVDVGRHGRGKKDDGSDELFRLANAPKGRAGHEAGEPVGIFARARCHRRLDDARCDRIDPYPIRGEVAGERLREEFYRTFRWRIAERASDANKGRDGCDVD